MTKNIIKGPKNVLSYDEALEKTFNKGTAKFQGISVFLLISALYAKFPLVGGLSFLEKLPSKFQCYQVTSSKMANVEGHGNWKSCTKEEICAMNL